MEICRHSSFVCITETCRYSESISFCFIYDSELWTAFFQHRDSYIQIEAGTLYNMHHISNSSDLRTYPPQYGKNLLRAFEDHIGSCPVRRDLRFKPQYNKALTELEQFELLGLGDCWEEANLLEVVTYLMTSSKCRSGFWCYMFRWFNVSLFAIVF